MFYKKQQQMNAKNSITRLRLYELKEAAIRGKHLFLEFSEYAQENTCCEACNFIKKETLKTPFLHGTSGRLLLN